VLLARMPAPLKTGRATFCSRYSSADPEHQTAVVREYDSGHVERLTNRLKPIQHFVVISRSMRTSILKVLGGLSPSR
jgi:hypothetical protein